MPSYWVFDYDAIDEARAILDIKKPVDVVRKHMIWSHGRYLGLYNEWSEETHKYEFEVFHRVSIASALGPTRSSKVLWHELTHAAQKERLGFAFTKTYDGQLKALGLSPYAIDYGRAIDPLYREIPLEREAFDNEKRHGDLSLVKTRNYKRRNRRTKFAITIAQQELMKEFTI